MDRADWILWILFLISGIALWILLPKPRKEPFIAGMDLQSMSTMALDSAPSTSEVKIHYKKLLLFADADIRATGTKALRLLADFRDRVYGPRDFRANLKVEDVLANYPAWLPPLDPTVKEAPPSPQDAVTAELRMLAYLQKNYPQEPGADDQTGSIVRLLIEDFGYRFVFDRTSETVQLGPDFLKTPLLQNWTNPTAVA